MITPNDKEVTSYTSKTWSEVVKNKLPEQLGNLPVDNVKLTNKGLGYLAFPNKEARDQAAENLKDVFNVKIQDKAKKSVYPKIKISGLNKNLFNKNNISELRQEILKKNVGLKELVENEKKTFEIIFINDQKEQTYSYAVAKVDPLIKDLINKNGSKLYIGLSACRVSDRVHLLQCYSCQQFGHKIGSTRCPLKDTNDKVCLYFSGNHLSRDCQIKKDKNPENFKCSNCAKSSSETIKAGAMGHTTTSPNCPIFQRELKAMLNRTMGMNSSNILAKNAVVT